MGLARSPEQTKGALSPLTFIHITSGGKQPAAGMRYFYEKKKILGTREPFLKPNFAFHNKITCTVLLMAFPEPKLG